VIKRTLLLLCLFLVWATTAATQAPPLRVFFFDVGQGDAVLIQSPTGNTVVYDAGDSPTRVIEHLKAANITTLDLVIASHNHADHIGGIAELIRQFTPRFYMDNGVPATTGTYRSVLQAVADAGVQLLEPTNRQVLLGGDASLTILPPPGIAGWEQNDNTVGAILTYGAFRLSLGGDAERRQWDWWSQHYPKLLGHVQIHKASHHGSNNGDIEAALQQLTPEVVIISVGANNVYQHPRPEALKLYAASSATVYRTDVNGTVVIEAQPNGYYDVLVERGKAGQAASLANTPAAR
jgi:competence protein ComEC